VGGSVRFCDIFKNCGLLVHQTTSDSKVLIFKNAEKLVEARTAGQVAGQKILIFKNCGFLA
jgi:hypothetical protein